MESDRGLFQVPCGIPWVALTQTVPKKFTVWRCSPVFGGFITQPPLVPWVTTAFASILFSLSNIIIISTAYYYNRGLHQVQIMPVKCKQCLYIGNFATWKQAAGVARLSTWDRGQPLQDASLSACLLHPVVCSRTAEIMGGITSLKPSWYPASLHEPPALCTQNYDTENSLPPEHQLPAHSWLKWSSVSAASHAVLF